MGSETETRNWAQICHKSDGQDIIYPHRTPLERQTATAKKKKKSGLYVDDLLANIGNECSITNVVMNVARLAL
jgi:hypothetical protein